MHSREDVHWGSGETRLNKFGRKLNYIAATSDNKMYPLDETFSVQLNARTSSRNVD